jgi:hypothetical protein
MFSSKIVLTAGCHRRNFALSAALRGSAALAGKNSFNRWRGWRDPEAGLLDWGCGCFQSFFGPFPGGEGVHQMRANASAKHL